MAEYIEREALLLRINLHGTNKFGMLDEDIRAFVKETPVADAAPVVHGRWIKLEDGFGGTCYMCSRCAEEWALNDGAPTENNMYYCPQCGAKMDEEETDR
nr:MAG TPA: Transcription initiation factor IIE, alpha FINGER, Transcription [Caudoviricetes sp.]